MLSANQSKVLEFVKERGIVSFVEIFPWAAENSVEHPDVVAKSLEDLGLIKIDYANGLYLPA